MTEESLPQNEADLNEDDLLFDASASGSDPSSADGASAGIQAYDFRRPARISKDRNRSLEAMYGLLVKAIASWVTGRVREQLDVQLQSVEQLTFGEFVLALPSPCASYVVDVPGTGRQGVIDFGHEFAYFLIDRLMGGVGAPDVPERSLTAIERQVVRIAAEKTASLLSDVWNDYVPLDLEVTGFESIPEMLRVANREDPVLVATLQLSTGDMTSMLALCLPFTTVEKFFTGTSSRRPEEPQGTPEERILDRNTIEGTLRDSRLLVAARLPEFRVPMGSLADLKPGQVLNTGLTVDAELDLFVAGQRRFVGAPGRVGQSLGVRVLDRVRPDPEDLITAGRDPGPSAP